MGLAASQARLLSITSRMSDNELRSQLISNAKMRLTTDSARVSDEYIAALNQTQLMFQNFDPNGNEMYQALTFTSLTAYSAYNNQYGIVNNSGELIVSATDAANFQTANGDLEKFLEKYGLKQTTDYFDTLGTSQEYNEWGVGYYDNNGVWQKFETDPDELQAMYEAEVDSKGVHHYGKLDSINSLEYGDYEILVEQYNAKKDNYKTKLDQTMKNYLKGDNVLTSPYKQFLVDAGQEGFNTLKPSQKFDEYYEKVLAFCDGNGDYDFNELLKAFKKFAVIFGFDESGNIRRGDSTGLLQCQHIDPNDPCPELAEKQNDPLEAILKENIQIAGSVSGTNITINAYTPSAVTYYFEFDENGNPTGNTWGNPNTTGYLTVPGSGTTDYNGYGMANYVSGGNAGAGEQNVTLLPGAGPSNPNNPNYTYKPAYSYRGSDGQIHYTYQGADDWAEAQSCGATLCSNPAIYKTTMTITPEVKNAALRYLWESLRNSALDNMSTKPFEENCAEILAAKQEYIDAAKKLARFIYGEGNGDTVVDEIVAAYWDINMLDYLDDPSWVLSTNDSDAMVLGEVDTDGDGAPDKEIMQFGDIDTTHFNPFYYRFPTTTLLSDEAPINDLGDSGSEYHVNYQVVKDIFLLDCMLEHYGEPKYTWIDQNDKNEDGQAKATWYSNLFARMQQGYTTLGEGLANNREWLQFAFESGLVHMEQVNKSSEWVSTMYSNCSAITESTVDVDITVAEAKYNREMAKIQAKDKQYDAELKNVETEHESLKQEYESIKEVISKNIDRNYKMFQNA